MKTLLSALALAFALMCSTVLAGVTGPKTARPGHMVVAAADVDRASLPANTIAVQYNWTVLVDGVPTGEFLPWPDGTKVVFSASDTPSTTTVILDVDVLTGDKKGDGTYANVAIASPPPSVLAIRVGDGPTPTPTPQPPAPPPLARGRYGLAPFIRDAFAGDKVLTAAEKAKVATVLARDYAGIAAKIAAVSTYRDVATILADTHIQNAQAIAASGVDASKTSAIKKALGDRVYALTKSGEMASPADIADAWKELQLGLEAVAR